jgi:hypothetical protein
VFLEKNILQFPLLNWEAGELLKTNFYSKIVSEVAKEPIV